MAQKKITEVSKPDLQAPSAEQEICITCGLCCDGTLFDWATVEEGEKAVLPEKLQQKYFTAEKGEGFKLPCPYFKDKCTIYNKEKAQICSSFRCQLLKDLSEKTINQSEAKNIVKNALKLRDEIFRIYQENNKHDSEISFMGLPCELRKKHQANIENKRKDLQLELLIFKSNILEILLIKHFKSSDEFEGFIMKKNNQ